MTPEAATIQWLRVLELHAAATNVATNDQGKKVLARHELAWRGGVRCGACKALQTQQTRQPSGWKEKTCTSPSVFGSERGCSVT